jgi:hypothetical protein
MENQRNQLGKMVNNQIANKTNKHLKERKKKEERKKVKKKSLVQEQ